MAQQIQIRRDTAANWLSNNPIIADGELAYSTDTHILKVGDGVNNYSSLDSFSTSSGVSLSDITYENLDNNGDVGSSAGTVCAGDDGRLSDARIPTSHNNTYHSETYITDTQLTTASGDIVSQIPLNFNSLYYTETELDNGQLDDRYYTESEVDILITSVSGSGGAGVSISSVGMTTGVNVIDTFADTGGDGCLWNYVIKDGTNFRTGTVMSAWNYSTDSITYTEDSTADIGDTSGIELGVDINSDNVRLYSTVASGTWTINGGRFLY